MRDRRPGYLFAHPGYARPVVASGLLYGREHPLPAGHPHEGPRLGHLLRALAAVDQAPAGAIERAVGERKAHRDRRILGGALAPGFRKVALHEPYVRDPVDHATARILRQLLGEIGEHLGRDVAAQRADVLIAVGGLDVAEEPLE